MFSFASASLTSSTLFGRTMLLISFISSSNIDVSWRHHARLKRVVAGCRRAAHVEIRFLSVARNIEPGSFFFDGRAKRHHQADQLQQNKARDRTVNERRQDGRALNHHLARIAGNRAVEQSIDALLGKDSRQERADGSADSV